jgi:aminopeptidase N
MSGGPRDDEIVNTPTDAFSSSTAYGVIIYNKGPLAFQAFREAMGDDSFFAAVASYYREHLLHIGQPDDLRDAFVAEAPPGLDFPELWQYWIEEANGREDFPAEVLDAILTVLRGI